MDEGWLKEGLIWGWGIFSDKDCFKSRDQRLSHCIQDKPRHHKKKNKQKTASMQMLNKSDHCPRLQMHDLNLLTTKVLGRCTRTY